MSVVGNFHQPYLNMKAQSWRHHYLQQFLIKGFLNENDKVFVYNKELDKIQTKEQSSKSIFFEENKNTIFLKMEIALR